MKKMLTINVTVEMTTMKTIVLATTNVVVICLAEKSKLTDANVVYAISSTTLVVNNKNGSLYDYQLHSRITLRPYHDTFSN